MGFWGFGVLGLGLGLRLVVVGSVPRGRVLQPCGESWGAPSLDRPPWHTYDMANMAHICPSLAGLGFGLAFWGWAWGWASGNGPGGVRHRQTPVPVWTGPSDGTHITSVRHSDGVRAGCEVRSGLAFGVRVGVWHVGWEWGYDCERIVG